jgi:replication factor C subunit 2/4
VRYADGVIERSLKVSDGDLRRAINLLQSAARLVGASASSEKSSSQGRGEKKVLEDSDEEMEDADSKPQPAQSSSQIRIPDIDEIAGTFPPAMTERLVQILQKGNTRNYNAIASEITDIVASGYAANEVLSALYAKIIASDEGDIVAHKKGDAAAAMRKKSALTNVFSEYDKRLIDGVDEHLALLDMSCQIAGLLAA